MAVTASQLQQDIYRLLDRVVETSEALEINRNGHTLRLVVDRPTPRAAAIRPIPRLISGDPEELVDLGWSGSWDGVRTLAP